MYLALPAIAAKAAEAQFNAARLGTVYGFAYLRGFLHALYDKSQDGADMYSKWLSRVDSEFDAALKSRNFASILSDYVDSMIDLRRMFRDAGYPVDYMDRAFDAYVHNMMVFSNIPGRFNLTPSDVVLTNGKTRLLHYRVDGQKKGAPLLVIYAPINRYHILDIEPEKSVVRRLASGGLDTYLLDWGHPGPGDDSLSLKDYVGYVEAAVDFIKKSGAEKVSILGYCWGGIMALIYSALHADSVNRLALMAVPVDTSQDDTILAHWARALDSDRIAEEFGHMDGQMLDLGFILRNPPRFAFDKYVRFFEKMHDRGFVDTFTAVERWLYNTPPIPGNLYRDIINGCYKRNALFKGEMALDGMKVDLSKIDVPVLAIAAEHDDLASPASTLAVLGAVSSKDKDSMRMPGGHVGLCVSASAHKSLWPQVARWLSS
ncbi:alpha/beta fold hydrolase [Nitrososphaera sp.]|uniref:alpha/beta fold hydrolase n=1 Tax=Nitrososphaera sp. TaxID=1971748 RepID=UPI0031813AE6